MPQKQKDVYQYFHDISPFIYIGEIKNYILVEELLFH
jgi:Zn-dependent peptidase ImmA (M78 family)